MAAPTEHEILRAELKWTVAVGFASAAVLMLLAYGYPIAQFFIGDHYGAVIHRVDGAQL